MGISMANFHRCLFCFSIYDQNDLDRTQLEKDWCSDCYKEFMI